MNAGALAPLLLIGAALSGCIGSDPTEPVTDLVGGVPAWAIAALPFEGHDHHEPSDHAGLSTPNFEQLGWDPLVSPYYGATAGGHLCGDSKQVGERVLGAVHGISTAVSFALVDVTDVTMPVHLAELVLEHTGTRDVSLAPDGRFVAIASTGPTRVAPSPPLVELPRLGGLCDENGSPEPASAVDPTPYPAGVLLANVEDPANVFVESVLPLPASGVHSIWAGDVNGETIILASITTSVSAAVHFYFIGIDEAPEGNQLVVRGVFQDDPTAAGAPLRNGHNDGVIQVHPITGETLAYLANWHQGMVIVNVDDMARPRVVGRYYDNPGLHADIVSDGTGNLHEAIPIEGTWNDRHYTFVGQEILEHPTKTSSGWIRVLDTTDPTNPHPIAEWSLPVDLVWDDALVFSTHYVSYHERTLYVAHYHAGVWALDLSNIETDPVIPSIGVFVPANVSPAPPPDSLPYDWTPTVMDANVLPNGDVVVWDATSGVYAVRFDPAAPIEPALPWGPVTFE